MGDIETLARTIWGEARGEGKAGMEAVASVIMNRVKKPRWWGRDVQSICLKPSQFSCWLKDDPSCKANYEKMISVTDIDPQYAQALVIAERAVAKTLRDPTGGATHYHASTMEKYPAWSKKYKKTIHIGNHIFYKE